MKMYGGNPERMYASSGWEGGRLKAYESVLEGWVVKAPAYVCFSKDFF